MGFILGVMLRERAGTGVGKDIRRVMGNIVITVMIVTLYAWIGDGVTTVTVFRGIILKRAVVSG